MARAGTNYLGRSIIPPTGLVGEMNLSAELRSTDELPGHAFFRRPGRTAQPGSRAVAAARTAAAPPTPPAPPALSRRRHSNRRPLHLRHRPHLPWPHHKRPRRRSGVESQLKSRPLSGGRRNSWRAGSAGARLLLTRAADATMPACPSSWPRLSTRLRRVSSAQPTPGPDLVQARNWYQRASEWGSPEGAAPLDALASFPRR